MICLFEIPCGIKRIRLHKYWETCLAAGNLLKFTDLKTAVVIFLIGHPRLPAKTLAQISTPTQNRMALAGIAYNAVIFIVLLLSTFLATQAMAQLSGHKTIVENPPCLNVFGISGKCPPAKVNIDLGLNLSTFQMAHSGG